MINICAECKHHDRDDFNWEHICTNPEIIGQPKRSIVTGCLVKAPVIDCVAARDNEKICGAEGLMFEAKPKTWIQKLLSK